MQDLGTLGGRSSRANDVNDLGQVVGYSNTVGHGNRAFLYSNGSMQDLGSINGQQSIARAINNSGQVVGSSQVGGGQYWHAFLYENGSMPAVRYAAGNPLQKTFAFQSTQRYADTQSYTEWQELAVSKTGASNARP